MTVVFDTVAVSRGQDAFLAFSSLAGPAGIRGPARQTDKAGSVLDVWDHIYPPGHDKADSLYVGIFSGMRPQNPSDGEDGINRNRLTQTRSDFFLWPDEKEEAAEYVEKLCREGREVYHCAHLLTARTRKKEYAARVVALYSDGDGATVPDGIAPTLTVESSPGKRQFYWRLTHPIEPEKAAELNKRLAYAISADRSGWDLTQLLRPPGTKNRKYAGVYEEPPIVRSERLAPRIKGYKPEQLDSVLPCLHDEQGEGHRTDRDHSEPPVVLDDYGMKVWRGEKVTWKEDGEVDTSASLLLVGRVLYNAGATRPTIVEALKERDESLGWRKYTDRSDSDQQYHAIVDELQRNGRTHQGNTSSASAHGQFTGRSTLGDRKLIGKAMKNGQSKPTELVEDVLLEGTIYQIYSGPGNGKSWVAMWLAKELIQRGK